MAPTPAFREHASGLYVPEPLSRTREVWTRDEWKTIDRAVRMLESRGVTVYFGCPEPTCTTAPIARVRRPDGGITLRCAHKDREFRSF